MAYYEDHDTIGQTEITVERDDYGYINIVLAHSGDKIILSDKEAKNLINELIFAKGL